MIVAVCFSSAGIGLWRGFTKETLALVVLLLSIWLAWRFSPQVEPFLGDWVVAPDLKVLVARGLIFLFLMLVGTLLVWLVRGLVRGVGLSTADRFLGLFFGFVRGIVLVGLVVVVLELAGLDQGPWWQDAKFRTYSEGVAGYILDFAALGSRIVQEQKII